jgi:hypothetical protein
VNSQRWLAPIENVSEFGSLVGSWPKHTPCIPGKRIDAHQVREAAYWAMLAGAAGHGYGNNNIYQFYDEGSQKPPYKSDFSFPFNLWRGTRQWRKALDLEGAYDMGVMRKLFELRPWYKMAPDQSVIAMGQGEGEDRLQAAR